MEVGISTASFFTKAVTEDSLNILNSMGVETIEIFLTTFREYRKEFIDLLLERKGNLKVHSVHSLNQQFEPELFNQAERTREDCEFFFRQCAEACARLGARSYTFHGPARLKRIPYILNYDWIAERLKHLDSILAEYGGSCRVAYENVHWTYFNSPEFIDRLLEKYPEAEVCLDIKQAMQSKVPLDQYIKSMANRLVTVHLCDYHSDGTLAIPGQGEFDFTNFFRKLIEVGYDGPLLMELYAKNYDTFDDVKRSFEYLKNCLTVAQRG